MNTEFNSNSIPAPLSILKTIISYLDTKRKRELILVFMLSLLASLAESISIAMLVPFISFFVNPDLYLFNSFFEKIFILLDIKNNKEILAVVSFLFIN